MCYERPRQWGKQGKVLTYRDGGVEGTRKARTLWRSAWRRSLGGPSAIGIRQTMLRSSHHLFCYASATTLCTARNAALTPSAAAHRKAVMAFQGNRTVGGPRHAVGKPSPYVLYVTRLTCTNTNYLSNLSVSIPSRSLPTALVVFCGTRRTQPCRQRGRLLHLRLPT